MHTHTIEYENFNGKASKKVLHFNLTEAEITKLQKDYLDRGGIQAVMNAAMESEDTKQLIDFFETLVHRSFGVLSADGEEFDKSPELMRRFENQAYYSDLYMSFFQEDGKVGIDFINKVLPARLVRAAEANVRGEGELAERAAAASAFKPDAREAFERSKAALQDRKEKEGTANAFENRLPEPVVVQETPQAVPASTPAESLSHNQPDYPRASTEAAAVDPEYQAFLAERSRRQAEEANQQGDNSPMTSRPPHESGPGFQQS